MTRLDSSAIANGELWYLIGADWLKEWHAFKTGDRPPGPIRNSQFLKDNGQPRAGMKRGTLPDHCFTDIFLGGFLRGREG